MLLPQYAAICCSEKSGASFPAAASLDTVATTIAAARKAVKVVKGVRDNCRFPADRFSIPILPIPDTRCHAAPPAIPSPSPRTSPLYPQAQAETGRFGQAGTAFRHRLPKCLPLSPARFTFRARNSGPVDTPESIPWALPKARPSDSGSKMEAAYRFTDPAPQRLFAILPPSPKSTYMT